MTMKTIIAIAMTAISVNAAADSFHMRNDGGGEIVLTDRDCKEYDRLFQAYSYTPKGYWEGCWALIDGKVHVGWKGNGRRVYDINDFTFKPSNNQPKKGTSL